MTEDANPLAGPAGLVGMQTLRRYWPLIAVATVTAVALAYVYLAFATPAYEAEVRMMIQHLGLELDGTTGRKIYDKELLSTQAELIRSPVVVGQALEAVPPFRSPEPDEDPVAAVLKYLRVSPLANTDIVRVTYQHEDARHATARLRSIIDSYRTHLRQLEQASATESFELLRQRESELSHRLESLQDKLAEIRATVPAVSAGGESIEDERALLKELTSRWAAVRTEQARLLAAEDLTSPDSSYSLSQSSDRTENPLIRDNSDLQADLNTARAELQQVSLVYGPRHPARTTLEARVTALTDQLTDLQSKMKQELDQRQKTLAAEEQALQRLVEQERQRLQSFDAALQTEGRLLSEIERVSELHGSTLASLETVGLADRLIAEGRASITVRLIDDFVVPQEPVWPQPVPLLASSAMLGLLLSIACIVLLETRAGSPEAYPAAAMAPDSLPDTADALETAFTREVTDLQETVRKFSTTGRQPTAAEGRKGVES